MRTGGDSVFMTPRGNKAKRTPRRGQNSSYESSMAPQKQARSGIFKSAVTALNNAVSSIWKLVKFALCICLVVFTLYGTVSAMDPSEKPAVTPDFVTLARLQRRLERVMDESSSVSSVVGHIKHSEAALLDLSEVVRHSSIAGKGILERDLERFVIDAQITSRNLQKFGSHVWEAVDRTVSLNQHAIAMLEWTAVIKSLGAPGSSFGDNVRSLVYVTRDWVTGTHPESIENLWLQAIGIMETTLQSLIHEAQDNVGSLQRLEERLHNIENRVVIEKKGIQAAEKALKRQWFRQWFGLNNKQLREHSAGTGLLGTVHDERNRALHQVATVLMKLEQMSKDLEDLRERVGTPLIVSSRIPIEAHIKSIQIETERLINGQNRMLEVERA